jgi:protein-L-isoaspartate(D-aspartate) O-methyltransferase
VSPGNRAGIGMTSARTRERLIQRLREQGIGNAQVLDQIRNVPRHLFVDEALATRAYEDTALPIGHGQTISQPFVVAKMSAALLEGGTPGKVLEIGTGCGYQTAVLAQIAQTVFTVERIHALVNKARRNLQALKIKNVRLKYGDGSADLNEDIAVDAIVIAAGATHVPTALLRYLTPGGRMVLPLASSGEDERGVQRLTVIESTSGGMREHSYDAVRFVPLLSGLS